MLAAVVGQCNHKIAPALKESRSQSDPLLGAEFSKGDIMAQQGARRPTSLRAEVDKSITQAVKDGTLSRQRHAAPIAMLRHMADYLDKGDNDGTPAMRYVTPASFLSYCDALGLTPNEVVKTAVKGKKKKTTTERMKAKYSGYDK